MNYTNWVEQLFEETYPRYDFEGGSLSWVDEESATVTWGGKNYTVELADFYNPEEFEPVKSLVSWIYRNLPLTKSEYGKAFVYWDEPMQSFRAVLLRGKELYAESISNPDAFPLHGVSSRESFSWSLQGSMLCIESKVDGIPALCPLSHPITLKEIVDDYFYATDEIHLMTKAENATRVFIGNKNPISRVKDEERGVLSIPLSQWVQTISKNEALAEEK